MLIRFHSILIPTHNEQNIDTAIDYGLYLATKLELPITFLHMVESQKPKTMVAAGDVRSSLVESPGMSYAQLEAVQKLEALCEKVQQESKGKIATDIIVESGRKWTQRIKIQQRKRRYLSVLTEAPYTAELNSTPLNTIASRLAKKTDSPTLLVPQDSSHIPVGKTLFITQPKRINLPKFHQLAQVADAINSEIEILYLDDEYDFLTKAKMSAFEVVAAQYTGNKKLHTHQLHKSESLEDLYQLIDNQQLDMISMATSEQKMWQQALVPDLSKRLIADMKTPLLLF